MVRQSSVDVLVIHNQMVRCSGIDRSIITAGWYADPTMIGTSSPLDGVLT
jgi:hypothetical protein